MSEYFPQPNVYRPTFDEYEAPQPALVFRGVQQARDIAIGTGNTAINAAFENTVFMARHLAGVEMVPPSGRLPLFEVAVEPVTEQANSAVSGFEGVSTLQETYFVPQTPDYLSHEVALSSRLTYR
jgi:hypothetical protein